MGTYGRYVKYEKHLSGRIGEVRKSGYQLRLQTIAMFHGPYFTFLPEARIQNVIGDRAKCERSGRNGRREAKSLLKFTNVKH